MFERHGLSQTPEYRTWRKMKERCYNSKSMNYKWYGGRGVTVCEQWRNSFLAFLKDVGEKPFPKAEIDRIDNDGNYEPGNCRWTTHKINTQHQRSTKLTIELAEKIREDYISSDLSKRYLAKKYKITPTAIGYIIKRKQWI